MNISRGNSAKHHRYPCNNIDKMDAVQGTGTQRDQPVVQPEFYPGG